MWHWTCTQLPLPDSVPKIMADDVSYVFSNVKVLTDKWGFLLKCILGMCGVSPGILHFQLAPK